MKNSPDELEGFQAKGGRSFDVQVTSLEKVMIGVDELLKKN